MYLEELVVARVVAADADDADRLPADDDRAVRDALARGDIDLVGEDRPAALRLLLVGPRVLGAAAGGERSDQASRDLPPRGLPST
jgi:hypothetical protein